MSPFFQTFRNVGRLTQIANVFVRFGFKKELQKTELATFITQEKEEQSGALVSRMRRLVMAFEELGPAFVKLGQFLSAREDLLPPHAIKEFSRLQDRVKPLPLSIVKTILDEQFEKGLVVSIDETPLGAASIAQVHKAELSDGRHVVFKIQRPELEAIIETDLSILMTVATLIENIIPEIKLLRAKVMVEELKKSLQNELDFTREAGTTERMRALLESNEKVHIPEIFRDYCRRNILCMEFIDGKKLSSVTDSDLRCDLVSTGTRAFFDMTFKHGIFHADLHPGNFLVLPDARLAIIDFGLVARLSHDVRNTLTTMFMLLMNEDFESFSRLFLELTEPVRDIDTQSLETEIRDLIEPALTVSLQDVDVGKLFIKVASLSAARGAPVSRELFLFFRAVVALESFGKNLDSHFDILKEATEYSKTLKYSGFNKDWLTKESFLLMRDSQALIRELPTAMRVLARRTTSGKLGFRIQSDELRHLAREVDRASNRLSLALLLGALVLGSSIITYGKEGKLFDSLATIGLFGFGIAAFIGVWLIFSILRSGRFK